MDTPDLLHSLKELMRKMALPRTHDLTALKRVARYTIKYPRMTCKYRWSELDNNIEVFGDANFAGCNSTRKSTVGGVAMWNGQFVKAWSKTVESEMAAVVRAPTEGMGLQSILNDILAVVHIAATAATGQHSSSLGSVGCGGAGKHSRHWQNCPESSPSALCSVRQQRQSLGALHGRRFARTLGEGYCGSTGGQGRRRWPNQLGVAEIQLDFHKLRHSKRTGDHLANVPQEQQVILVDAVAGDPRREWSAQVEAVGLEHSRLRLDHLGTTSSRGREQSHSTENIVAMHRPFAAL